MARLHLRIPETQIPEALLAEINEMNGLKPWLLDRHDRSVIVTEFYERALEREGLTPVPTVAFERGGYDSSNYIYEPGDRTSLGLTVESAYVTFRRWRTVAVLAALVEHLNEIRGGGPDPMEFACSALYRANPISFRSSARNGHVPGVSIRDTYSAETWQRLVQGGLVNELDGYTFNADAAATFLSTGNLPWESDDEDDEPEDVSDAYNDDLDNDDLDDYEPEVEDVPMVAEDDVPEQTAVMASEVSDGLDGLGISQLRRVSRGFVSGGYSLRKPALIHAIRQSMTAEQITAGVEAEQGTVAR